MDPKRTISEFIAPNVATAIQNAQAELGVSEDDLEVEIVDTGDTEMGRDALIRVMLPASEPQPEDEVTATVRQVVLALLGHMEIDAEVTIGYQEASTSDEDPGIQVDIDGEDLRTLIGRRGETMAALQYIANLIMAKKLDKWVKLNVDVGGYKKHREQQLRRLAQRMAQQVDQFGRPISLEPMPAYERRIIHITLQERVGVSTKSSGEGSDRRVTIQPEILR